MYNRFTVPYNYIENVDLWSETVFRIHKQCSVEVLEIWGQLTHPIGKYRDNDNFSGVSSTIMPLLISNLLGQAPPQTKYLGTFLILLC